ncbi:MAG: hypothetical protein K0Q81_1277 [Paenibacillus sp.]|jgi:Zn-dependent metalloprotease|nr:hypothetical protein [Paenibacillus sp.]
MKKYFILSVLITMLLIVFPFPETLAHDLPRKARQSLQKLHQDSGGKLEIKWNDKTNTPFLITGVLSSRSEHTPEWIAYKFLNDFKVLYSLQNPKRDMQVVKIERDRDHVIVHFQRMLFQTPVWENRLAIEINHSGIIQRVEGNILPDLEKKLFHRPLHAALSKKQAIDRAKAIFPVKPTTEPELQTYYLADHSGIQLIYAVKLQSSEQKISTTFVIHSASGRLISHYQE